MFILDTKLEADSYYICDLNLCQLRLMKDGDLTWFLLIPLKSSVTEWIDLSENEQQLLAREISHVTKTLKVNKKPDKINIATIGNMVPQFHLHIIARYKKDRAWPGTIWGTKSQRAFDDSLIGYWQGIFEC